GILHRDLKPANILLAFSREPPASAGAALAGGSRLNECVPKITDFGLAKLLGADAAGPTRSGELLGTPCYMAPEQIESRFGAMGPPRDVYGLGATLSELWPGRPPFRAATTVETLLQVREADPVPPCRLQPAVPRDLDTICLKCLVKEPRHRYAAAEDLAEDL